jgi:lysophospholipase L1-like esterase
VLLLSLIAIHAPRATALPTDILLIGDSITEGSVSYLNGTDTSCLRGLCYAERLSMILGSGYQITNAGVGGSTTVDWTRSTPAIPHVLVEGAPTTLFSGVAVPSLPSEIVLIMLGVNDAIGFFEPIPTLPSVYSENLDEMIHRIFDLGANQVILVKPTPLFAFDASVQNRLKDYGSVIDSLCATTADVICGPDLLTLLTRNDFERDDLHPNPTGHEKIAMALADGITSVPEPSAAVLTGMGLAVLGVRRRRRIV